MDWSRAKTIFIISFIFLNSFLYFQLRELNYANQMNLIIEATLQERLNEMNVAINDVIEEELASGFLIVGKNIEMTEQAVRELKAQEITFVNETTIISRLDEPYPLEQDSISQQVDQFLNEFVMNSDLYQFSRLEEDRNQLLFIQHFDGKVMYSFDETPLVLQLDDQGQIVAYQQMIYEVEASGREQEFLSGLKAIERLLNEQLISANQTITEVDFGYYSFFKPLGNVQVFAPMWRISVNGEDYLVNAIDGSVQDVF
ncbi:two-component system regulatory protein YycI [Alkalihalobacterium alkalinitrilicum]|uniref:two-component system regulatory protein YycI n=1 Tax=Alkalihalobacterium alkalinitrilicum TaxID=427920 RepID=UPI0009959218|nr:two-component system regulatory protein YycI [Alkalihalobacterium alkalinitrilicum]